MPAIVRGEKCQLVTEQREVDGKTKTVLICATPRSEPCPKDRRQYDITRECFEVITAEDFLHIMYARK